MKKIITIVCVCLVFLVGCSGKSTPPEHFELKPVSVSVVDENGKEIDTITEIEITDYKGPGGTVVIPREINGFPIIFIGEDAFRGKNISNITIPKGIVFIRSGAFAGNLLKKIVIPESITSIEAYAFYGNLLSSITIPESIASIGWDAFNNNPLTSITIKGSVHLFSNSFPEGFAKSFWDEQKGGPGTYTTPFVNSEIWTKQ